MSAPGTTGQCARCGAMVRWASLAATGKAVMVEPLREQRYVAFGPDADGYRNIQAVQALVPHAQRCAASPARPRPRTTRRPADA